MDSNVSPAQAAFSGSEDLWSRVRFLAGTVTRGRELGALLDQALVSGANFITNVVLARAIGLSGFGVFALSWALVLLMSNLCSAFLVAPMMSIGPKQTEEFRPVYLGGIWGLAGLTSLASGLVVYAGTLVFAHWRPRLGMHALVLPFAIATTAYVAQDFTRRYLFFRSRATFALVCDALSYLTQLPLLAWMGAQHQLTVPRAYWIIGVTSLLGLFLGCFGMRGLRFQLSALPSIVRRNANLVRWLVPSSALQWASLNFFMVSAPVYYGAAAAGALRACQNLVAVAHIWFLGLDNVLPAEAAEHLHHAGSAGMMHYLRRAILRWGTVTAVFMLVMSIAPSFWLHLLYGARYGEFGYVLRLYGVLYLLIFLGGPLRAGLQAVEYSAPLLWSYLAMTAFAAATAAPMAKHFGLSGVMLGLIASQLIFQVILGTALVLRTRTIRDQQSTLFEVRA